MPLTNPERACEKLGLADRLAVPTRYLPTAFRWLHQLPDLKLSQVQLMALTSTRYGVAGLSEGIDTVVLYESLHMLKPQCL